MKTEKIKQLIDKYLKGQTTLEEEQILREYFCNIADFPDELQSYQNLFGYFDAVSQKSAGDFDPFAKIDLEETEKSQKRSGLTKISRGMRWTARIAAGIALLIIGFAAGRFLNNGVNSSHKQVNPKVQQMKAALMNIGENGKFTAGKRLEAVSLTQGMTGLNNKLDQKVADILTYTINNDDNVNVRLAAAEALFNYRNEVAVKRALIHSLGRQDDPMMQITLINMLVKLKAKGAIPAMQQMLAASGTQKIVRQRLKTGMAQLQA
jgi:uncharacterized membrane-anchored protein YhcB (DUF1043 family)